MDILWSSVLNFAGRGAGASEGRSKGREMSTVTERVRELLGVEEAARLLEHHSTGIRADRLHTPGPDFVERVWRDSDRPTPVLGNLQRLFDAGRLAGSGYLSILPVDQGVEHSAGASFTPNPDHFDPESIVRFAVEAGCSAVATSVAALGTVARRYAHRIPFIAKLNHNQLLTVPQSYDQVMFAHVEQAADMGAVAVAATVYFGSEQADRQMQEVREAFRIAHRAGLVTVLWCYLQNPAFRGDDGVDLRFAADLSGQAVHLGASLGADIVKQRLPLFQRGADRFPSLEWPHGVSHENLYDGLMSDHPVDLTRFQVANAYMGRIGLLNSGGPSGGAQDLADAVRTAVINKRAGGIGLISGRKAFQRSRAEGAELLRAIQDVYLSEDITVA